MMTGGGAGRGQRRILWFVSLSLALLVALGALLTMTPIAPSVVSALHHASASPAPQHTAPCIGESCALGPGVRDVRLFVEPDVGAKPVTSAIAAATHSVWVEVYLLTDAPVIAALEDARRRGVDVRVMLDEHPYGFDVVSPQRTLQTLATAGIQAKFANSAYTYTHAKMLIIDGATLYILTANLSQSGLGLHQEPFPLFSTLQKHRRRFRNTPKIEFFSRHANSTTSLISSPEPYAANALTRWASSLRKSATHTAVRSFLA